MTGLGVRRDKAMLFQWVKAPPGEVLQPEATGAVVEVTKRLKPSVKRVTKYGDGRANLEKVDAQADPATLSGKADTT